MIRQIVSLTLTAVFVCAASLAAEQTWTGQITAGMCKTGMAHDCVVNCIKAGEKYVFVTKGKILQIQNQDFIDLEQHAGQTVKLTGDLGPDGKTVTVTKVATVKP